MPLKEHPHSYRAHLKHLLFYDVSQLHIYRLLSAAVKTQTKKGSEPLQCVSRETIATHRSDTRSETSSSSPTLAPPLSLPSRNPSRDKCQYIHFQIKNHRGMVKPLSVSFVLCFILLASLIYRFLKSNIYNSVTVSHSSKSMWSPTVALCSLSPVQNKKPSKIQI